MVDGLLRFLGWAYAFGVNVTGLFLFFTKGPSLLRWFFRNRPRTVAEWVSIPFLAVFSLVAGIILLAGCSMLWPVTLTAMYRDWRRDREKRLGGEAAEYENILEEVRSAGSGGPVRVSSESGRS